MTASVAQPIHGGIVDYDGVFRAVARLYVANGDAKCSGVLVTPRYVLTAAHCLQPDHLDPAGAIDVKFGVYPHDNPEKYHHYAGYQGAVVGLGAFSDDVDDALDLALVQLAEPVPFSVARPVHPPLSNEVGVCGSGWDGFITGYGKGYEACEEVEPWPFKGYRQFGFAPVWVRNAGPNLSDAFTHLSPIFIAAPFNPLGDLCARYVGLGGGDSGGGLFKLDATLGGWPYRLCGINAGHTAYPTPGAIQIKDRAAAVDSSAAAVWLQAHLLDVRGEWFGECAALRAACPIGFEDSDACVGACGDVDFDGVPNACDDCPSAYNPEQLAQDDDVDGDGIGDACDLCPSVPNWGNEPAVDNCNYETELSIAYPGDTEPPRLFRPGAYPSDITQHSTFVQPVLDAETYYRDAFALDRCDPHPCPRQGFMRGDGWLPGYDVIPCSGDENPPVVGCNCSLQEQYAGFVQEWHINNRITLSPIAPKNGEALPPWDVGAPADVGLRWCPCADDTKTLAGRVRCQWIPGTMCAVDWNAYYLPSGTTPWQPIRTYSFTEAPLSFLGLEWGLTLLSPHDPSERSIYWKFTDLTSYLTSQYHELSSGAQGGVVYQAVHGVLWASVVADQESADWKKYPHTYQAGNAEAWLSSTEPGWFSMRASDRWWLTRFCPSCPEGFTRMVERVNDPLVYEAVPSGLVPVADDWIAIRELDAEMAEGQVLIVEASEPLGRIARLASEPVLRAVALDRATTAISRWVVQIGLDGPPFVQLRTATAGSPELEGDEGLVLSSTLRKLFVIGGNVGGALDGACEPAGWVLDVDENLWTELTLPEAERPGPVLGAAYRMEDYSVYLVDRRGGELVLDRWQPGGSVETIATLPTEWGEAQSSWLVAGHGGDLVYAASTRSAEGAPSSILARFIVDRDGRLAFAGMAERPFALLGAPVVTGDGMALVVEGAGGGALAALGTQELGPAPAGGAPIVHGWPSGSLVAFESAWVGPRAKVGGDALVLEGRAGAFLTDGAELVLGPKAELTGCAMADRIRLEPRSVVGGSASYNELTLLPQARVRGELVTPLELPISSALPRLPSWPVGGDDVVLEAGTETFLAPGSYGQLVIEAGAGNPSIVTLGAGRYGFESLSVGPHARLECTARCEVRISGELEAGPASYIGPAQPGVGSADVRIFVEGAGAVSTCPSCEPFAAGLGSSSELRAYLFAPNGTIHLGAQSLARGRLVGRHVWLGASGVLADH